jgi:tellurite resistance protein
MNLNIFRLFQRWKQKGANTTKDAPEVSSTATPIPAGPREEMKTTGPATDVLEQSLMNSAGLASSAGGTRARWIGPEMSVTVAGRNIGGMIYLAPERRQSAWDQMSRPVIDPSLPVAGVGGDLSGESMPYWPSYSVVGPEARATYLDWLASGRSDKRYSVGYVFLYFYGLERRFFVDRPDEGEKELLIAEVERLLGVYGDNRSVKGYLGTFLDAARATVGYEDRTEPRIEKAGYELPLSVRITIGRMSREGLPISADWLLRWYVAHPDYSFRTPATRAFPEFRALFGQLLDERFPEGMPVPVSKRTLRAQYRAASSDFVSDLGEYVGHVPDISRISRPLNTAKTIVDDATDALDRYSRFLGRNPDGRGTIEAHALLPQRLWPLFPCQEVDDLRRWAEEVIVAGGLVPVVEVIERLENAHPEKIAKRRLTDAADALARLSIGMAPDPRFALRSPKYGEPVVLFRLPEGVTVLDEVSSRYKSILVAVAVGSFVAQADDAIASKEHDQLIDMIDAAEELPGAERARLRANLDWMMAVAPDLALFRRHVKELPNDISQELGKLALALAASDGVVSAHEVSALERLYRTLGLETDGIYSAIHTLISRDEPVTVLPSGDREEGFAIPSRPDDSSTVNLDAERIASVMANTERVSSILGAIFQEDEPEEEMAEAMEDVDHGFTGLDARHSAFLGELLVQPHWEQDEYETLARQFQLMPAGAVETLNEWSLDHFDDLLLEEGQGFSVNQDIKAEITVVAE